MRMALSALEVDEAISGGNVDPVILDLAIDGVPYEVIDLMEGIRKMCSVFNSVAKFATVSTALQEREVDQIVSD